jgi:hypothetical protein
MKEQKIRKQPKIGDKRIVRKFLLFPKALPANTYNISHTRWLEFAYIRQEYKTWEDWPPGLPEKIDVVGWVDECFVD